MKYLLAVLLLPWLLILKLLWKTWVTRRSDPPRTKPILGFFHPYCNDGGGGERVLWNLVRVAQTQYGDALTYRLYHGEDASEVDILAKTRLRFGIVLPQPLRMVRLQRRAWVEAARYPALTLLGQLAGGAVLALDALLAADAPDFFFDTMGYPWAYPAAAAAGCRVLAYTHYPLISADMLARVQQRRPSHNNGERIAGSAALSRAKSLYYRAVARLYAWGGRRAELALVNSSWTRAHVDRIWRRPGRVHVVHPAVDTAAVRGFPLAGRERLAVSISQFRPEKDHALQVRAFAQFLAAWRGEGERPRLVMIGAVRNDGDRAIVDGIHRLAKELGLERGRDYAVAENVSYAELLDYFRRAKVGLHSMWNEHFGIGVVELLAAGVLTIAHNSGGPQTDILCADPQGRKIGFLASSVDEYAAALKEAFATSDTRMQELAREAMGKFSEQNFAAAVAKLLPLVIDVERK